MSKPWWRKVDPELITPYRVLVYGLDTWDATLRQTMDREDGYSYAHHFAIDIWRTRHWIRELGPHLDEVLHEFAASAVGIAHGGYFSAASMHELSYRRIAHWLWKVEDLVMHLAYDATHMLWIPPEFADYDHEQPSPEALESIWDGEMRIWSPPYKYSDGHEMKWQDLREHFEQLSEIDTKNSPTHDEVRGMKAALQQEVCRAYARRVEIRARHDRSEPVPSPAGNGEPIPPVRKRLRPAETTVLEVIAESKSRMTRPQIMTLLEGRSKLLGESTVKAALGTLTTLGYIDNRQDVEPPGYAVTGMYPGIDFPD